MGLSVAHLAECLPGDALLAWLLLPWLDDEPYDEPLLGEALDDAPVEPMLPLLVSLEDEDVPLIDEPVDDEGVLVDDEVLPLP